MSTGLLDRFFPNYKDSATFKMIDFIFTFLIYFFMALGAHEMFHAQLGRMLGYQAIVHFPSWTSGFVTFTPLPVDLLHIFLIGIAGGGLVALFFFGISFVTDDWETDMVMWFFVPFQGIYAILEVLYMMHLVGIVFLGLVPPAIAVVPFIWKITERRKHI